MQIADFLLKQARLRPVVYAAIALVLTLAYALPAHADPPMTFRDVGGFFGVLAEGEITAQTPADFAVFLKRGIMLSRTIHFNSGGGDLEAGLALGREIRRAGWDTDVGTPGLSFLSANPGECDSACTFAYLGGVKRSMTSGSRYGVHRFWGTVPGDTQQETQKIAGELVAYIREMGVSAEMYTLMTEGAPEQVKYLDLATMTRLNIATSEVVEAKMADERGVSVLHLGDTDSGGFTNFGEIDFYCNGPRLMARGHFLPPIGQFTPAQLSVEWNFDPAGRRVPVPLNGFRYLGKYDGKLDIDVLVTPALLRDWILPATGVELTLTGPSTFEARDVERDRVGGGSQQLPANFRTLLQTVASSCH